MAKIIEGYWDCPYCDEKGIGGLKKSCPNCNHPQDKDTTFYMKSEKVYLSEEKAKDYGKGADWTCSYCESLNRYKFDNCVHCGAPKEDSTGDYFDNQKRKNNFVPAAKKAITPVKSKKKKFTINKNKLIAGIAITAFVIALIAIIAAIATPRTKNATIVDKYWTRTSNIESYETVSESDWSVPSGGRVTSQRQEIHHYNQILDHYESVQVQKSRQVVSGYNTVTEYINNGDGTFSEYSRQEPIYSTEYYYETEEQPVYRSEPEYRTKYYYDIEKWIVKEMITAEGKDDEPYWPTKELQENQRIVDKIQQYCLVFNDGKKNFDDNFDQNVWEQYSVGDEVTLIIRAGIVEEISK